MLDPKAEVTVDPKVEAAIKEMILKVAEPLNSEDLRIVERAKSSMEQRFAHGFNQLLSLGVDTDGNEYEGLQLDCPIGQDSVCAEISVIVKAVQARADLTTIVTVHERREDEGGDVHVVSSCACCNERLLHFFPNIKVLVWFDHEVRKVPVRVLVPLVYKRRSRPTGNGNAANHFPE